MEEREDVAVSKVRTGVWVELLVGKEAEVEMQAEMWEAPMVVHVEDLLEAKVVKEVEEDVEMGAAALVSCLEVETVDRTGMFQSIECPRLEMCQLPRHCRRS